MNHAKYRLYAVFLILDFEVVLSYLVFKISFTSLIASYLANFHISGNILWIIVSRNGGSLLFKSGTR